MVNVKLYDMLRRVPDATDDEAQAAISEVAFKDDIKKVATTEDIAKQETRLIEKIEKTARLIIMWMIGIGIALFMALKHYIAI